MISDDHGGTPEENQAIVDALNGLNVLKSESTAWASKRVGSLQTTDRVFLARIGEGCLSHSSPQKVRRVRVLVCGSQVGSSINMEAGSECAAARSLGEAGPVLPFFSPTGKDPQCTMLP